ncbi:hypothetical protein PSAC2689_20566 [Paraburkholderia sacchari]
MAALDRLRADDLRGRDDGLERAVLQRQGARCAASRPVRGHAARGGGVRARVVRSAVDAVRPLRALRPFGLRVLGLAERARAHEPGAFLAARAVGHGPARVAGGWQQGQANLQRAALANARPFLFWCRLPGRCNCAIAGFPL